MIPARVGGVELVWGDLPAAKERLGGVEERGFTFSEAMQS